MEPIRRARWPIVLGVLAGLLVALGGVGYALVHPVTWTAERSVVIVPGTADRTEQAALYDSLSHGQVTATAGEIYSQHQWHPDTPGVTVTAGVIPPSSVLQVTAAGTDRAAVESALQQVLDNATPEANRILSPYRAEVLNTTPVSAHTGGLSTGTWIGIALFAGVLAAAVTIMVCHAARARVLAARASASGSSSTPDRSRVRPRRG